MAFVSTLKVTKLSHQMPVRPIFDKELSKASIPSSSAGLLPLIFLALSFHVKVQ